MNGTLIYVDLKESRRPWPIKRPQRWYWTAKNGKNQRVLARSSETYTNRSDCIAAIYALFDKVATTATNAVREKLAEVLGMAVSE